MTTTLFSELGLSDELLKAIDKLGFEQAAPIQAEAIPALIRGKEVVGQTRLCVNVRGEMAVSDGDVVGTILGETGLPRNVVGAVDIWGRHLFVDVASEYANSIISKLNRAQIKGRRAKAKVA